MTSFDWVNEYKGHTTISPTIAYSRRSSLPTAPQNALNYERRERSMFVTLNTFEYFAFLFDHLHVLKFLCSLSLFYITYFSCRNSNRRSDIERFQILLNHDCSAHCTDGIVFVTQRRQSKCSDKCATLIINNKLVPTTTQHNVVNI
jgi:hypothetical protein